MEYLSRVLGKMSELPDFRYHPMCKETKLTHLVFADDLMIFCKENLKSIARVMEALQHFSDATGLEANIDKSSMFVAGVDEETRQNMLKITGFTLGTFPIRYLGLPLTSRKWNKMDCKQLVDKITSKITAYTRQLSYAGRLQIIMVVLFSIYNFWSAVFILPQSVVKLVDKKCRDFLWGATEDKRKVNLVAG
ncbi:PREDICTED: uncharacterized protein LOC109234654 [Nicotiana attenuata]|uniref:uncharacterized protein LOC109234654 n=1 Tax=Nicotiana attenuata TaxID=49451 RepID=UPI000904FB99|nr:PREDICTED: uncharacterized protein LOC109234654 [Nicotiana attenuata]